MANPFSSYVTAEGIPPKLVHRWFSPAILEVTYVRKVTNAESQWVIGTPGSGKTMLLRMLTFAVQREIPDEHAFESEEPLRNFLGSNRKYVGVYVSCDEDRLYVYGDGRLDDQTSVVALGDLVGTRLAIELLDALSSEAIARIPGASPSQESRDQTARVVAEQLLLRGVEASIETWGDLTDFFIARRAAHYKFTNYSRHTPDVEGFLAPTMAPYLICTAARQTGLLAADCSLYVIIDQADRLVEANRFAMILREAILEATRSRQDFMHLKIGLRRHSMLELKSYAPMLSIDREMQEVEIDALQRLNDKRYTRLLRDICRKRIAGHPLADELCRTTGITPETLVSGSLEEVTEEKEAYEALATRGKTPFHLRHYEKLWRDAGVESRIIEGVREEVLGLQDPIKQMMVLIDTTKQLRESTKADPRDTEDHYWLWEAIEGRHNQRRLRAKLPQPALFLLLRILGKRKKTYSGFEELAVVSERNISFFLETLGRVFDRAPRDKDGQIQLPISASIQTSVVYEMSSRAWQQMEEKYTQGVRLARLIQSIADELRQMLTTAWLPRLCLCAVDMEVDPEQLVRRALDCRDPEAVSHSERLLALVLRDAFAAGYLRSEMNKEGKSYRLRISRNLLPLLGLPFQSQQEPPAISLQALHQFFTPAVGHDQRPVLIERLHTMTSWPTNQTNTGQLALGIAESE